MKTIAYTIGTLVTNPVQYAEMKASLISKGFTERDCEYIFIDNTGERQTDAYAGLNQLLLQARGERIILCHQDILLLKDGRQELDDRLAELTELDPYWAVAGNAGGVALRSYAVVITLKDGKYERIGMVPSRVMSVDENFIVVTRESRIGFSRDLTGFHMYGADLCLMAEIHGYHSYVIDFNLVHLSNGHVGESFRLCRENFRRKWEWAFRDRFMQTTCTYLLVSGRQHSYTVRRVREIAARLWVKLKVSVSKRIHKPILTPSARDREHRAEAA